MAYNPFDDVIENDPAYMANGGELQRSVLPQKRVNYDQETFKPIATAISKGYQLLTPEQETKDEIEKNKQLRQLATAQALKGTQFEEYAGQADLPSAVIQSPGVMERLQQAGYKPQGFIEGMSRIGEFFYGDQRQAFDKLSQGQQLTDQDRTAIAMSPLDSLDFLFPPLAIKKLGSIGLKTVDDVLKSTADMEEVKQIKNYFGGQGFTPAGVVREADMGGSAPIRTGYGEITDKIKNYVKDKENVTVQQIAKDLNINEKNVREAYRVSPEIKSKIKKSKAGYDYDKIRDFVNSQETTSYEEIKNATGISSDNIRGFFSENPTYQNKVFNLKKKNFGRGPESVSSGLKYLFDSAPQDKLFTKKEILDEYGIVKQTLNRFLKKNDKYIEQIDPDVLRENWKPMGAGSDNPTYNRSKIIQKYKDTLGIKGEAERKFFDGIIRSSRPEYFGYDYKDFTKGEWADFVMKDFQDNFAMTNWKDEFATDLNTYKTMESDRKKANKQIKNYFNEMQKKYPEKLKDLNYKDFELQIAHNFPLGATARKGELIEAGGLSGAIRLSFGKTNMVSHKQLEEFLHQNLMELKKLNLGKITTDVVPKEYNEIFAKIDKKAKDLGTVIYFKLGDKMQKVGMEKTPSPEALVSSFKNHINKIVRQSGETYTPRKTKKTKGFTTRNISMTNKGTKEYDKDIPPGITGPVADLFNKGGEVKPVKMAMGGDPLQNINQQQFSPDPAFEGQDYFQEAVDSGNLQAFNPTKIFRLFNKTDAVYTPKKLPDAVDTQQPAPPGTTLPTTQTVQPEDFAFQSFTLNKINDAQAPKAGTPEAWKQYLYGGGQGGKAPESEMFDSGLEQYLDDFSKYYPNQKITKQQLNDYYEMSPIGNIEIKVKGDLTNEEITNPGYREYVGGPRHQNQGNQDLDKVGTNYREIVVNSGPLPGDKKPFVESGHFNEKNVLGFTRVANYTQPDGKRVAVIQEMQTDMLTKVRKEQERLQALLKRIENIKATANRELQTGDTFRGQDANRILDTLNAKIPPAIEQSLIQNVDLIKPFPNEAARSTIPDYQKQLTELQSQIDSILSKDIKQSNPETGFTLKNISDKQQAVLDNLMDLNRSGQLDDLFKGIDVPASRETDDLRRYAEDPNVRSIEEGLSYSGTKKLELFPPVPFNKQADYVDLLLKATIKDAQSRGIQKVAIYPSDLVNQRWGKNPNSDAGKKFTDLYGKVAIQQMKNIAKKYGGTAKAETVMNPNLSDRGLTYYKRNLEGEYEYLKQDQLAQGLEPEEAQLFINEQLKRNANTLGANQVIYTREIAPGQTMDYYVQPKTVSETTDTGRTADFEDFELVPLGPGDDRNAAQVLIEEYDPREIQMFTITLDSDKAQKPMFMFKKKSGGTIAKDSLLSITDIYGEYGR